MAIEPDIQVYVGPEYGKPEATIVVFKGFQNEKEGYAFLETLIKHGIAKRDITKIQ